MKKCKDCGKELTGHGKPKWCRSCSARHRYIKQFGKPPEIIIAKCEVCDKEFRDYASNRTKSKHGNYFCSAECRVAWTGVHNSISNGGDGSLRTKSDKDKFYYRKTSAKIRERANEYYRTNRKSILKQKRDRDRALKQEVVQAYGGKCECCGETHIEFLTIDHSDGSGAEHRRQTGKGRKIYQDLKRLGFPKDRFRLLCLNCNISLGFYGYCPHRPDEKREVCKAPRNPGRKRTVV